MLLLIDEDFPRTNQQPDAKETKKVWSKILEQKKIIEKPYGNIIWKKVLPWLEENLKVDTHLESQRATLKKT